MPRLREVPLAEAPENVRKYYRSLFGDRDPVAESGKKKCWPPPPGCSGRSRVFTSGMPREQIAAMPHWQVADCFDARDRAVLAWTDALILQGGRASDELFAALHEHLSDEDILELTYHVLSYNLHAVMCKALRLEYDDVDERIREVPVPRPGEAVD